MEDMRGVMVGGWLALSAVVSGEAEEGVAIAGKPLSQLLNRLVETVEKVVRMVLVT